MNLSDLNNNLEFLAKEVHNAWLEEKISQGFHAPLSCPVAGGKKFEKHCDKCHTDMYPYEELSEHTKEYDRVTVRAVLNAISKLEKNKVES